MSYRPLAGKDIVMNSSVSRVGVFQALMTRSTPSLVLLGRVSLP